MRVSYQKLFKRLAGKGIFIAESMDYGLSMMCASAADMPKKEHAQV